jgi:hypothetical protein
MLNFLNHEISGKTLMGFRFIPTRVAINESVEVSYEIFVRVFRRVGEGGE